MAATFATSANDVNPKALDFCTPSRLRSIILHEKVAVKRPRNQAYLINGVLEAAVRFHMRFSVHYWSYCVVKCKVITVTYRARAIVNCLIYINSVN